MRKLIIGLTAIGLITGSTFRFAFAVPRCKRQAVKSPKAPTKAAQSRNAKGKFAKCGTPGASLLNSAPSWFLSDQDGDFSELDQGASSRPLTRSTVPARVAQEAAG